MKVLEAYKKISDLEVAKHTWCEQQREMTSQLTAAKQRVGDAEREAAHAIGNFLLKGRLIKSFCARWKIVQPKDILKHRCHKPINS